MSEPTAERRIEPRLRCLLGGRIVLQLHQSTMDCTVRSISAHGARILCSDPLRVPDEFELEIPHHDQMHHAEVVWRKGEGFGLALSDVAESNLRSGQKATRRDKERARLKAMADACYG